MPRRSLLGPADENLDAGRNAKLTPDERFIRNLHTHPVLLAIVSYQDKPGVGFDGVGVETGRESGHRAPLFGRAHGCPVGWRLCRNWCIYSPLIEFSSTEIFGRRTIPITTIRVVFYIDSLRRKPPLSTIIFKVLSFYGMRTK